MHLHTTATVTMIVAVVVFKASHCNTIALSAKMTRIKQVAEATILGQAKRALWSAFFSGIATIKTN